jgi:basic membrane lipoprotein Med (substrate-binding protein (PBP1-ABC) superfamily)
VDSDQSDLGPGVVLASVVKNLDTVVDREIEAGINGSFKPGQEVTGIETNGSSLVFNPRFSNLSSIIENRYTEAIEMEEKYSLSHS